MYKRQIFTSVNGVTYFFNRLRTLNYDIRDLAEIRICAIGPQTAEALQSDVYKRQLDAEQGFDAAINLLKQKSGVEPALIKKYTYFLTRKKTVQHLLDVYKRQAVARAGRPGGS